MLISISFVLIFITIYLVFIKVPAPSKPSNDFILKTSILYGPTRAVKTNTVTVPSAEIEESVSNKAGGALLISLDDQASVVLLSIDDTRQQQLLDFIPALVAISSDGRKLAYLSNGIVYIKDLNLMEIAQFDYETSGNVSGQMAWSADGTNIGFGCYSNTTFHLELCLLNVQNGERQELTNFMQLGIQSDMATDGVTMGNWSEDGSKIAYITRVLPEASGHARGIIQVYNTIDGSIDTILDETKVQGLTRFANPSISPDGSTLLFSAKSGDTHAIYRIQSDGSQLKRVTSETSLFDINNPIWSPDGNYFVAFTQDQNSPEARGVPTIFTFYGEIVTQFDLEGMAFDWISN